MKKAKKKFEGEVIFNVPNRLKYYLDPLAILLVATAITVIIILAGKSLF